MRCLVSRFRQRGRSHSVHARTHTSTGTRALLRLLLFRRGFKRSFSRGLAPSCVFVVELVCALRLMLDPCRHSHTSVHATSATASSWSTAATATAFFIEQRRKEQVCPTRQLYEMVLLYSASTKSKRGGQKEATHHLADLVHSQQLVTCLVLDLHVVSQTQYCVRRPA